VGAAAAVVVAAPVAELAGKFDPLMVALTPVLSPAWLLGCHDDVVTPPEVVEPVLGVKVVVKPDAGYAPLAAAKETGTPACAGVARVTVTVNAAVPAVYEVEYPETAIDGAVSA